MSQAELADAVDVTEETVSNWETGKTLPRVTALERLEVEFELPPGRLVDLRAAQERQRLYDVRRRNRHRVPPTTAAVTAALFALAFLCVAGAEEITDLRPTIAAARPPGGAP